MFSTMIHDITHLTISEPKENQSRYGGAPYYVRTLEATTEQGKICTIDLFGGSLAALTDIESTEADYWREAAADASARADAAEAELLRLHRAIDRITDRETS